MIVEVQKEDIQHFWNCLQELKPLSPPDGKWNASRVCVAASVCVFELLCRCMEHGSAESTGESVHEHDEARLANSRRKVLAVMQLLSHVVGHVATGSYDGKYERVLRFAVDVDGDDRVLVRPLSGFKEVGEGDLLAYDI